MRALFCLVVSVVAVSCGGSKDVIQSNPGHPASPSAPAGAVAEPPAATDSESIAREGGPAPTEPAPGATDSESIAPPAPAEDPNVAIAEAEKAAFAAAQPVFDKHCGKCHGPKGKRGARKHFDMTSYPYGGHHAGELGEEVREVLGVGGEKPTMPADKPGAVQGAELDAIVKWSKAFEAAHEAGLHKGHHGHGGH